MAAKFLAVAAQDAVKAFVDTKLAGGSDSSAVDQARGRLGGALAEALGRSDEAEKWKALALPLADIASDHGAVDLSLLAPSARHAAQVGDWAWTLTGDASMQLRADVMDAEQLQALGVPPRDGHQVVRYALAGQLGADAAGRGNAGIWSLSAGAQASAAASLEWYVAAPSHRRLGEALLQAVPFMLPPMSLADQLERAGDFEYWGCTVQLQGDLSASFGAAAALAGSGWTRGFDGDQAKLGLSLSVSGNVAMSVGGDFRIRCITKEAGQTPGGGKRYGIEVVLERVKTQSRALALALSAGVDASALAASADRYLRSHLPDTARLDDTLGLLTQPGTTLVGEIQAALQATLADAKSRDLLLLATGFGDPAVLAASLAERAAAPLADEIDRLAGRLDGSAATADALVESWLKRAFGRLPIADEQRGRLAEFAKTQLTAVQGRVDGALGQLATRLSDQTLAVATQLLQPFAVLGDKIQARLAGLSEAISSSQAAEAVKAGLADYGAFRDKILGVLSDAQRAKVTLAVAGSLETASQSQAFLRVLFVPAPDLGPAQRLFQALWSGRLEHLRTLVDEAQASGAIAGQPEGWLMRASRRTSTLSLTISLLGHEFRQSTVKTSELQLQADLAGNVLASGSAQVVSAVSNYWNEREARMAISVLQSGTTGMPPEISFNGAYSAMGKGMSRELFEAMQRALARVSGGTEVLDVRALVKRPDGGALDDKDFRRNVGFLLPIALQADEFQAFVDASDRRLQRAVTVYGLRGLDAEYGEPSSANALSAVLRDLARSVPGSFDDDTEWLRTYLLRFPPKWKPRARDTPSSVYTNLGLDPGLIRDSPLHRNLAIFFRLSRLLRSVVRLRDACAALRGVMTTTGVDNLDAVQLAAQGHLRAATDALADFSVASLTLIGSDEMVAWPFATLAAVMADVVGRPVPPGFVACAVLRGQEGAPIPLIAG